MMYYETSFPVRYYETDQMGIVHHSNYIRYFECARNLMIRDGGYPIEQCEADGVVIPIVSVDCKYKHSAKMGDVVRCTVTPSVSVAMTMTYKDGVSVVILGGSVIRNSMSTRDSYCLEGLRNINCSKLFFSCDGLDFATGVITAFLDEARLTQAMTEHAKSIVLLADSSKFGKTGFGKICELRDIDILVTDEGLPDSVRTKLEELGVHVIIARGQAL